MTADPIEQERFRELFSSHFADLWRFARRRCASTDVADDVTAQVFAVAWRRRDDLPDGDERLWLFGVARNVLANERRSAGRLLRLRAKVAVQPDLGDAALEPGPGIEAASTTLSLDALSPSEREAVQLRYWEELSVAEIARLLECTPNAVSLRLHKARQKLAGQLDAKDPVPNGHVGTEPTAGKDGRS